MSKNRFWHQTGCPKSRFFNQRFFFRDRSIFFVKTSFFFRLGAEKIYLAEKKNLTTLPPRPTPKLGGFLKKKAKKMAKNVKKTHFPVLPTPFSKISYTVDFFGHSQKMQGFKKRFFSKFFLKFFF